LKILTSPITKTTLINLLEGSAYKNIGCKISKGWPLCQPENGATDWQIPASEKLE